MTLTDTLQRQRMTPKAFVAASLSITAIALAACGVVFEERSRVRLSIKLVGQNYSQTVSSVSELQWMFYPVPFDGERHIRGHALLFDLGPKGHLIAALTTYAPIKQDNTASLERAAAYEFGGFKKGTNLWKPELTVVAGFRGRKSIAFNYLPQFIWLRDPADPWHAQLLNSTELAQVLPGLHVGSATIETTTDRVDMDFDPVPPWLAEINKASPPPGVHSAFSMDQIRGF